MSLADFTCSDSIGKGTSRREAILCFTFCSVSRCCPTTHTLCRTSNACKVSLSVLVSVLSFCISFCIKTHAVYVNTPSFVWKRKIYGEQARESRTSARHGQSGKLEGETFWCVAEDSDGVCQDYRCRFGTEWPKSWLLKVILIIPGISLMKSGTLGLLLCIFPFSQLVKCLLFSPLHPNCP